MKSFRIHVADEVLDDLRTRLRRTRFPDQISGIGWTQGTELGWLQRLVSYWNDEFDWRAWEQRLNAMNHFTWEGIHFVHQRAVSGRGMPLILTHGWPCSFLDYVEMLPLLQNFDLVIPSLPGYAFSPRPPQVGVNYRYIAERWHKLMSKLGYTRYGAGGYDFGAGVSAILAMDYPTSVIGIHLTTPDIAPVVNNVVEADYGKLKQLIRPVRGFKTLKTAYATIRGFEVMRALRKGQAAIFNLTGGVRGEARIVERAFGIGARALAEAVAVIGEGLNLQTL